MPAFASPDSLGAHRARFWCASKQTNRCTGSKQTHNTACASGVQANKQIGAQAAKKHARNIPASRLGKGPADKHMQRSCSNVPVRRLGMVQANLAGGQPVLPYSSLRDDVVGIGDSDKDRACLDVCAAGVRSSKPMTKNSYISRLACIALRRLIYDVWLMYDVQGCKTKVDGSLYDLRFGSCHNSKNEFKVNTCAKSA
eukprot:1131466-Pelagomonas_calceolata.AAC.1